MRSSLARCFSCRSRWQLEAREARPITVHEIERVADHAAGAQPAVELDLPRLRDIRGIAHVEQLDASAVRLHARTVECRPADPAAKVLADGREKLRRALRRLHLIELRQRSSAHPAARIPTRSAYSAVAGSVRAIVSTLWVIARRCRRRFRPHGIDVPTVVLHEVRFIHAVHLNGRG